LTGSGRLGRSAWIAIPLLLYAVTCLFVWADDSWRVGLSTGVAWLASRALQTWKVPATMDGAQTTVGEPARRYHVIHRIEPASPPPVAGARRAPR
jgi:hypothetical protein